MYYLIGWSIFLIFFKLYFDIKVVGRENIPARGAFIFASNHTSYLDPILLGISIHRGLYYMARDTLFKKRYFGWIMSSVHAFPVKRNDGDYAAIKKALGILAEGKPLVIFPEGTRAKDENLRHGKPGIGFIAAKSDAPVIPAYIKGSFGALPRGIRTLRRSPITVYIGKPVIFGHNFFDNHKRKTYQKSSDEIMRRIVQLKEQAGT